MCANVAPQKTVGIDPIRYELYRHRLFNILEEGRIAMRMVSGSPVVVEGGETMSAIYSSDGTPILVAAGILLHCVGAKDFIVRIIEMYEESPGIYDGDQIFVNDPYVGGQHLPDQVMIKPVFYGEERIAWVGSIMHTSETGGIAPGGMPPYATEIYQEGIRISGLKMVEKGEFRKDVFNAILEQVRDKTLVGLDIKAKIASNNVCANALLELVDKYGLEFVTAANERIIRDSELEARELLRELPNGTWRSRQYGDNNGIEELPFKVVCAITKKDDHITFDYTGSSPQNRGSLNSTLPATWGSLFVVLASSLFWNVSWNGGMFRPVELIAPKDTVVNCTFPAACSTGVASVGCMITQSAHECIAKMLYAAGKTEEINSGWMGGHGNPYFGAKTASGMRSGVILDTFAGGLGATPYRDGVDTGGNMMNPQSCISDVEILEQKLPLLYLKREQCCDSGGYGKFRGGLGGEAAYMIYGTEEFHIGIQGIGRRTPTGHGIFGGYPPGMLDSRLLINSEILECLAAGQVPGSREELEQLNGKTIALPMSCRPFELKTGDVLLAPWSGGGGYGDPLERDPVRVREDVMLGATSLEVARNIYGVVFRDDLVVDEAGCEAVRKRMRRTRLEESEKRAARPIAHATSAHANVLLNLTEGVEVARYKTGEEIIRCRRCGEVLGAASDNYKLHCALRIRDLNGLPRRSTPEGMEPFVVYQEFACPSCATLLQTDSYCPVLDSDDPVIWDIQLASEKGLLA